ncbi:MAG: hypothetical protein HY812_09165 [Planctomycetes bacterium]|nr:hypothetical protein [Planctomycetota bacterium]
MLDARAAGIEQPTISSWWNIKDLEGLEKDWPATDLETWGTKTGATIDRAEELGEAVAHALAHPEERAEVRRAAAEDFFYHPGDAAAHAAERLLDCLGLAEGHP